MSQTTYTCGCTEQIGHGYYRPLECVIHRKLKQQWLEEQSKLEKRHKIEMKQLNDNYKQLFATRTIKQCITKPCESNFEIVDH